MGIINSTMTLHDNVSPQLSSINTGFIKLNKIVRELEKNFERLKPVINNCITESVNKINSLQNVTIKANDSFEKMINSTSKVVTNLRKINKASEQINFSELNSISNTMSNVQDVSSTKLPKNDSVDMITKANKKSNKKSNQADIFLGNLFGNLASNAVYNFINTLSNLGKEAINTASSINEIGNVVNTVFSPNVVAQQIEPWSKEAINKFGLTELQAKNFVSTMGAILSTTIPDDNIVTQMSISLASLAGDLASFYNLNIEDAFYKLRAGMTGETEPLKTIGINLTMDNLNEFANQKGIEITTKQMTQAQLTMLRYAYIIEHTRKAQGDFMKTSQEFANKQRVVNAKFQLFAATIASMVLPVLTILFDIFIKIMDILSPIIQVISTIINTIFDFISANELLCTILKILGTILGGFVLYKMFMFLKSFIMGLSIIPKFISIVRTLVTTISPFTSMLFWASVGSYLLYTALEGTTPAVKAIAAALLLAAGAAALFFGFVTLGVGFIVVLIVLLILWIMKLWKTNEKFRDWVKDFIQKVRLWVAILIVTLITWWNMLVTEITLGIKWLGVESQNFIDRVVIGANNLFIKIKNGFKNFINWIIDGINWLIEKIDSIPLINIGYRMDKWEGFDTSGSEQIISTLQQQIEERNAKFNAEAEGRREYDKIKGINMLANEIKKIYFPDKNDKDNKDIYKGFDNLFGGDNNLFNNPNLDNGINIGGGKGKGNNIDRVGSVGKIEDSIEVDSIEVLVELARDRYGHQYNTINPNISISINRDSDEIDAIQIAEKVSYMLEEALGKLM